MKYLIGVWLVVWGSLCADSMTVISKGRQMQKDLQTFNQKYYRTGSIAGTSGYSHGEKRKVAIVLIHGLFMCENFFSESAKALFNQGYNVLNLTLPGHEMGQEGDPETNYEKWIHYTEAMLQYAHTLGEKVVVVGHSFGGALGVYWSQKKMVDGLVLLQPALRVTPFTYGLSMFGEKIQIFRPQDKRMRFMLGTAATAFEFWKHQPNLSQVKVDVPTLLYSSRIDPLVSESGHLEFSKLNPNTVELVRHFQVHMTNFFSDLTESQRIEAFLQKNFPLESSLKQTRRTSDSNSKSDG